MDRPYPCRGCVLDSKAFGYAPAVGPASASIFFMGEALGYDEALQGQPFVGAAGALLNRVLHLNHIPRESLRIDNLCRCQPPNNWLDNAPWEWEAINTCKRNYRDQSIEEWLRTDPSPNKTLVTLGAVPLRNILNLPKGGVRVQDFHGTVQRDPIDRFWVVPTYHPSYIQCGAFNLIGVMSYDLQIATEVAAQGYPTPRETYFTEPVELVLDPSPEWFAQWAANYILAVGRDPEGVWLAVDIETPDKAKKTDEGELTVTKDRSYQITRINFSCNTSEGITVPFMGPYLEIIGRVLSTQAPKALWNAAYDVPRLRYNHIPIEGQILDFMWAWHVLQSDLPRGLGFVAPFYSSFGPWKHLNSSDPVRYAAIDGVQTLRIAHGVIRDLQTQGMEDIFWRHVVDLDTLALHPAEEVGLPIDTVELEKLRVRLQGHHDRIHGKVQAYVPQELLPLVPKSGLTEKPEEECSNVSCERTENPHYHKIVERTVPRLVKVCKTCGATEITKTHRCQDRALTPQVTSEELQVVRFYRQEEFNPGSPQQLLTFMRHFHLKPGKDKKTKKDSANRECVERLAKSAKAPLDQFFQGVLDLKSVDKILTTYVNGSFRKLKEDPRSILDGRLHPTFLHKPSTLRLSCQSPNLQNVVADRAGGESLAAGFRNCIVASPGAVLLEADFSGIEAVLTGWFCGDPSYIRLAKLGIHAFVASHLVGDPADAAWDDDRLRQHLKHIKEGYPYEYNQCKRCVHGTNYGLTERGMVMQFPKEFPTMAAARKVREIYFKVAPSLPAFQLQVRERAHKDGYLGGPGDHPFGYKHWFFNVMNYRPVRGVASHGAMITRIGGRNYQVALGEDAKRAVAFYPQSTAAGVLAEVMLRLFTPGYESYIGDAFYGRTPLIAPIHDSLLLEVPEEQVERIVAAVVREMTRPITQLPIPAEWGMGEYLSIGVEVKRGRNWAPYDEQHNPQGMKVLPFVRPGLAVDSVIPVDEYDEDLDEEEVEGLKSAS